MWECEQGFSALMSIKLKSWNCFAAPGDNFRCAVSKVIPRTDQMWRKNNYILFIKAIIVFSVIFCFFQLWTDACLIKTLLLHISELLNFPNVGGTQA